MKTKSPTYWQTLNLLATLITLVVNGLANALPLNGQTTGEISDRFAIRFVPARYVFSIWGLIYLGLIGFTVYQALPGQRENATLKRLSPYYWLVSLANSAWIFLWHYEVFALTLVVMLVLLGGLIVIFLELRKTATGQGRGFSLLVSLPFSVYLGWISVATIANASQLLYYLGWNGWGIGPEVWAVIMLVAATGLGGAMLQLHKDAGYALVLVWAFLGIAVEQGDSALILYTAWLLSAVLLLGVIMVIIPRRKRPHAPRNRGK